MKKSSPVPIEIRLDRNPTPRCKPIGGGQDDRWNDRIADRLLNALPSAHLSRGREEACNGTIAGLVNINPADPIEGMVAAQMIAAHEAALGLYCRAWNPEQSLEVRTKYLALADKAARTVAVLTEALNRHRGRGQQTVVVKHVTVKADQALVTDKVVTGGGGGVRTENDKQPHAQAFLADAPGTPLPCAVQTDRKAVPIARDAERPLPTTWWQVAGSTEGK